MPTDQHVPNLGQQQQHGNSQPARTHEVAFHVMCPACCILIICVSVVAGRPSLPPPTTCLPTYLGVRHPSQQLQAVMQLVLLLRPTTTPHTTT